MPTLAQAGPGWVVKHNGTTIAEVRDVGGPEQSAETDDATNQSSTGFYREKVSTLLDGGDFSFDCNYLPGVVADVVLVPLVVLDGLEPAPGVGHESLHLEFIDSVVLE